MAVKTPQQAQANWAKNFAAAGPAWSQGIQNCTVNPAQLAIAALPKAIANYTAAAQPDGAMAKGLAATTPTAWKQACAGAQGKLTAGAQKGSAAYLRSANKLAPYQQQASAAAAAAKASGADPLTVFNASMTIMQSAKGQVSGKGA